MPASERAASSARSRIGLPSSLSPVIWLKERVNAIALASAEDFRRDSDLFVAGLITPEAQDRIQTAMKLGFQTRDAEMDLARMLKEWADH